MSEQDSQNKTFGEKALDALSGFFLPRQSQHPLRTERSVPDADRSVTSASNALPLNQNTRAMYQALEERLKSEDIAASNLQVLGLSALREKIGDQWVKHKNVIQTVIEGALGKAMTAHDRYWRLDDEIYVIAYADNNLEKAVQRTEAIGAAIVRQLVGTEAETLVSVRALTGSLSQTVDGEIKFTQVNPDTAKTGVSPDSSLPIARRATEVTFASLAKTMRGQEATDDLDALLQQSMKTHEERTGGALAKKAANEFSMEEALRAAELAEQQSTAFDYSLGFSPIWDVKKMAITAYAVIPYFEAKPNWYFEHSVLGKIPSFDDFLDLDIACLRIAIRETAKSYTDGSAVLILSQIHYTTLSSKAGLAEILKESARVPDFLRKYIAVQIVGIPADMSLAILTSAVTQLHHHFRLVAGRFTVKASPMRIKHFGFDIVSLVHDAADISTVTLDAYKKFLVGARNHALPAVAEYISSPEMAHQFAELGMASLSGRAISDPMNEPQGVLLCDIEAWPIEAK